MLHRGRRPDEITYYALASSCGHGARPQRAFQLLEAMVPHELLLDGIISSSLAIACEKGARPQRDLELLA